MRERRGAISDIISATTGCTCSTRTKTRRGPGIPVYNTEVRFYLLMLHTRTVRGAQSGGVVLVVLVVVVVVLVLVVAAAAAVQGRNT
jgi:hypothetical protein